MSNPTEWDKWTLNADDENYQLVLINTVGRIIVCLM